MGNHGHGDDAPAAAGMAAFAERLDVRDVDELLGFAVRRTRDPQVAADLTAETFAAALLAHRSDRTEHASPGAWLQGIALERLADAQRRGLVESSARRRLGMARIELAAADAPRIEALRRGRATALWADRGPPPAATDFARRLRTQLREAAAGGERRDGVVRRASTGRRVAVAVVAGVLVAVMATVVSSVTDTGTARSAPGPRVVANVVLADGLGRTAQTAFGSVWLSATNEAAVLRVDPRTRRVIARIPVGTDVNIGAGGGGVWAVPRRPTIEQARLIRIDPRTNRVVARIPIPSPGARYPLGGATVLAGPRVWVVGAMGLVAVDPRTDRPVRQVVLGGDYLVVGSVRRGHELWLGRADGSITRFDATSGRRLGRLPWIAASGVVVPGANGIVDLGRQTVGLVEPVGGRARWRRALGTQLNDADVVGGRMLVEGADGTRSRDTLWELDPKTGNVLGTVTVPGFSIMALLRVGRQAWLPTADGHVIVVDP
jgi:DNA-directed RNA polymerase specialized sigma24 family protein